MQDKIDKLIEELREIGYRENGKLDIWKGRFEDYFLDFPKNKDYWLRKFNEIKFKEEGYGISADQGSDISLEDDPNFWAFQKGKEEAISLLLRAKERILKNISSSQNKKVFVVHGRNLKIRDSMFEFLMAIDLEPIEWEEAVRLTGSASPFTGEILENAFTYAQAIVVLFTPDDIARLKEEFQLPQDLPYEKQLTGQARPNVIFEAGLAFGKNPTRKILIHIGHLRPFSDIAGRNYINLKNDEINRKNLIERLKTAGCDVELEGDEWLTTGNFSIEDDFNSMPSSEITINQKQKYQEYFNALVEIIDYGFIYIGQESIPVNERSEIIFSIDKLKSNKEIIREIEILCNESRIGQQEGNYHLYLYIGNKLEIVLTMHDFKVQKIRMSLEGRKLSERSIENDKDIIQVFLIDFAKRNSLKYTIKKY